MKEILPCNNEIAKGIRMRMAELDITKKELAEKIGVNVRNVGFMCSGLHDFSIQEVVALEKALDIDIMLVPDTKRVITVTMNIDNKRHQATVSTTIEENGKVLQGKDVTPKQMFSSANALMVAMKQMQETGLMKMLEEEQK